MRLAGPRNCVLRALSPPSSLPWSWSSRYRGLTDASYGPCSSRTTDSAALASGSLVLPALSDGFGTSRRDCLPLWTAYLLLAVFVGSLISMPPYSDRRHRLGLAQACCDSAPVPSSDCWRVARLLTPAYHLQRWVDQVTEMLLYSWSPRNLPEGVHSAASC